MEAKDVRTSYISLHPCSYDILEKAPNKTDDPDLFEIGELELIAKTLSKRQTRQTAIIQLFLELVVHFLQNVSNMEHMYIFFFFNSH